MIFSNGPVAAGGIVPTGPDLEMAGWQMLAFSGIPETAFQANGDGTIRIHADKSASVLYHEIADAPAPATRLSWEWRVDDGLPATDLTKTDGDDRALSIYVAFSDGSMTSRIKAMVSPLAAGNVLNYVWGGDQALDIRHPHFPDSGRLIVLRPATAETGIWFSESVDLAADYQRAFGTPAPGLAYIGISSDADDVGMTATGAIRNIRWQ